MSKSITEKSSISIKGILNIGESISVEVDGEVMELSALLSDYDGSPVTISVSTSTDIV